MQQMAVTRILLEANMTIRQVSAGNAAGQRRSFKFRHLLLGLIGLAIASCGQEPVEAPRAVVRPVKTYRVEASSAQAAITLPGKVRASKATLTYQVTLEMPQPEEIHVLPGMTATVLISPPTPPQEQGSVVVPAAAVLGDPQGQGYVWLVDPENMTVHKRSVALGRLTGSDRILVREGLKEGDLLVVAGRSRDRHFHHVGRQCGGNGRGGVPASAEAHGSGAFGYGIERHLHAIGDGDRGHQ